MFKYMQNIIFKINIIIFFLNFKIKILKILLNIKNYKKYLRKINLY